MDKTSTNRVPHIIFLYWVIKIASTTLGETGADMLSMTFKLGYAQTIMIYMSLFVVLLGIKLFLKGYHPVVYWLVFTASALVGTGISDFIDRTLGLGYALGSADLIILLLITLAVWYKKERSIKVLSARIKKEAVFADNLFTILFTQSISTHKERNFFKNFFSIGYF